MRELIIYLDDVRTPDFPGVHIVRDVPTLQSLIRGLARDSEDTIVHLSLDHDLGEDTPTGYDFLNWLEASMSHPLTGDEFMRYLHFSFEIHSANPVGRQNMLRVIDAILRRQQ